MLTYKSNLLASLLFTGLAIYSPVLVSGVNALQPSSFEQQLSTQQLHAQNDCPDNGQSPAPGCGRRDK